MNETLKIIEKRFSCRDYLDKNIEEEKLLAIVKAGVQAPSGINAQPWEIILVKNKTIINEMDEAAMDVLKSQDDKSSYTRMMERGGKMFYNAPTMVFVMVKESYSHEASYIDCGIVAQNMVLAATSLGIDNVHCGMARLIFDGKKANYFRKILKIKDEYPSFGLSILLGYGKSKKAPHEPDMDKIIIIN